VLVVDIKITGKAKPAAAPGAAGTVTLTAENAAPASGEGEAKGCAC
jgi:hypothetical protein